MLSKSSMISLFQQTSCWLRVKLRSKVTTPDRTVHLGS